MLGCCGTGSSMEVEGVSATGAGGGRRVCKRNISALLSFLLFGEISCCKNVGVHHQRRSQKESRPPRGSRGCAPCGPGASPASQAWSPQKDWMLLPHPHRSGPGPTWACLFVGSPGWCPEGGWSQNEAGAAPQAWQPLCRMCVQGSRVFYGHAGIWLLISD